MQRLINFFVFLLLLSPTFAAEKGDNLTINPVNITLEIPQKKNKINTISTNNDQELPIDIIQVFPQTSTSIDLEQGDNPNKIDTLEDVENTGCAICCLQTIRTGSTVATGLFGLLGGLGKTAKTALITLSVLGQYSSDLKKYLGITSTIVSGTTIIANIISNRAAALALSNQKELQEIEDEINEVWAKYNIKQALPLFKANPSHVNLSIKDQKTITKLQERHDNITNLNDCEKGCFSFLNSFFSCSSGCSQFMGLICNISNLVMVPLATLPLWDTQTAQALAISVVVIEAGSVFFQEWSQQAKQTNKIMTNLKNELDKYN